VEEQPEPFGGLRCSGAGEEAGECDTVECRRDWMTFDVPACVSARKASKGGATSFYHIKPKASVRT
jgi:hypothetical protein